MLTLAETSQKIPQTTVAIIGRWTGLYHRTGSNHKTAHRRPARYQKPGRITLNIRRLKRLGGSAFQAGVGAERKYLFSGVKQTEINDIRNVRF